MKVVGYKIKNVVTGEYSKGGSWPTFSKTGKVWSSKGALHRHFSLVEKRILRYSDCIIVPIVESEDMSLSEESSKRLNQLIKIRKLENIK